MRSATSSFLRSASFIIDRSLYSDRGIGAKDSLLALVGGPCGRRGPDAISPVVLILVASNRTEGGGRGNTRCCRVQSRGAAQDRDRSAGRPQGRRGTGRDQGDRNLPYRRVHVVWGRFGRALSSDPRP